MKNVMEEYINFTCQNIRHYMKMIFRGEYDEEVVEEFLNTYINARYYNVCNKKSIDKAFYLRITDSLSEKEKKLEDKYKKERIREEKFKAIHSTKKVFQYVLFFDNVRKIENFKSIDSLKEVVKQLAYICQNEFDINLIKDFEKVFYSEVSEDMIEKDIFLDKFEADKFNIEIERFKNVDNVYRAELNYDVKIPMQYSYAIIDKVYNNGLVGEKKLFVEYTLLSVMIIRDILDGNFKDKYIADFLPTLFSKGVRLNKLLEIISNQAIQDRIYLNISYQYYLKYKDYILNYTKEGFCFAITLDEYVTSVEDVKKLKMFKYVVLPEDIKIYKELIKHKNEMGNIIVL